MESATLFEQAEKLVRQFQDISIKASVYGNWGNALAELEDFISAFDKFKSALKR